MSEKFMAGILPILALRGLTVFPDQTVHFDIGRNKSIKALDVAMKGDQASKYAGVHQIRSYIESVKGED